MRLVSYNIQFGRGRDGRVDLERIASEVRGADLVALQEVDCGWSRSGKVDQPEALAGLLDAYYWVYGPWIDLHAAGATRGAGGGRRRRFGNMLLARTPILAARNHLLPKYASLGPASLQRSALEGVVETGAGLLRVYSVHLTHLSAATRLPQVEALLAAHRLARVEGAAVAGGNLKGDWTADPLPPAPPDVAVLMGDFNAEPDSEEYARIAGPRSDYGGRIVNPEGFVDAWTEVGHREGDGVTSDIRGREVRIDYCFVSASLRDRIRGAGIDTEAKGSDHQPIWLDIDL